MKKGTVKLSVDNPCHEDWNKMSPTEQGRFCKSCQKEVVDFSVLPDTVILQLIEQNKGKEVCGQFQPQQLNRSLYKGYSETSIFSLRAVLLGATITSLLSLESCSSGKNVCGGMYVHETEVSKGNAARLARHQVASDRPLEIRVTGAVSDSNYGRGLSGVFIQVFDENGEELVSVKSDEKGDFTYFIHDEEKVAMIVFSKEGYETLQLKPHEVPVKQGKMKVQLTAAERLLKGKVGVR